MVGTSNQSDPEDLPWVFSRFTVGKSWGSGTRHSKKKEKVPTGGFRNDPTVWDEFMGGI